MLYVYAINLNLHLICTGLVKANELFIINTF